MLESRRARNRCITGHVMFVGSNVDPNLRLCRASDLVFRILPAFDSLTRLGRVAL
jgi:hypothetical protein